MRREERRLEERLTSEKTRDLEKEETKRLMAEKVEEKDI
jgi:hypothetical protein